jgi:hypothetical protein
MHPQEWVAAAAIASHPINSLVYLDIKLRPVAIRESLDLRH